MRTLPKFSSEILQCAQEKILTGRRLDITNPESEISGDIKYILVDKENLLVTGLDEISALVNCHLPIIWRSLKGLFSPHANLKKNTFMEVSMKIWLRGTWHLVFSWVSVSLKMAKYHGLSRKT